MTWTNKIYHESIILSSLTLPQKIHLSTFGSAGHAALWGFHTIVTVWWPRGGELPSWMGGALLSWKWLQTMESDMVNYRKRYLAISWNTIGSFMFALIVTLFLYTYIIIYIYMYICIILYTIYTCTHARVSWMRIRYPALVAQLQISSNFHVRNIVIHVACFWVKQCTCRREFCINPQHDQHGSHHFWLITSLWLQMAEILERGFHCRAIFFGAQKGARKSASCIALDCWGLV